MAPDQGSLKATVTAATLIVTLSLGFAGGPRHGAHHRSPAASGGEQALARVVEASRSQTVVPLLTLQKYLFDAQAAGGKNLATLAGPAADAHAGLIRLRDGLESVAAEAVQTERGSELFFSVVVSYYGFVGLLDTAYDAANFAGQSIGPVPTDLDLTLPAKTADAIVSFKSQQAKRAGLPVYDISFDVRDAGGGNKTLSFNASEVSRYRMGAFMAFPSDKTAKDELRFEALKLVFANQALMNSDLYSDEKVPINLPDGTDPLLISTRNQADLLGSEGAYRAYVTSSLVHPISTAIAGARPDFRGAAHAFYETVAERLASRVDLRRLSQFIPDELTQRIQRSKGADRQAALAEAADNIADKFLTLEGQQRLNALSAALKASPKYLTQMTRDELRAAVGEAVRVAVSNLALVPVEKAMMSVDALSAQEQALMFAELDKLVQASFSQSALPDSVLADFERSRADVDVMASFRRYDLAQKLIAAADWLDGAKKILDKLSEADTVPVSALPAHPDPGMALLAFKPQGDNIPTWVVELMQALGAKAAGSSNDAALRALMGIAESTPTQMLAAAQDAHDAVSDGVLAEIQALNNDRKDIEAYSWSSLTSKMRVIGRRAQSQGARKILLDLLRLNDLATKTSITSLASYIREAFQDIVEKKSYAGIDQLVTELASGKAVIDQSHDFVQAVFSPPAQRDAFLRKLLTPADVFRSYVSIHMQDMQNSLPMLFQPVKLSAQAARDTGDPNALPFSELIARLKTAISVAQADVSVGDNVINALTTNDIRRGASSDVVPAPATPYSLMVSALAGTRLDASLENKLLDFAVDKIFHKGAAVTGDPMWPTQYKMRDLLPACFDQGTSAAEKVRRVTVASLLTPYLRSAALNGAAEVTTLLDPKLDPNKALVQSEAYRLLVNEAGNDSADGLTELQKKALVWKTRWENVKRVTAKTQSISNFAFYETLFLDIPAGGQILANLYMALSSAADFTSDIGLFIDYVTTYADMKPFANANALGRGLIPYSELEGVDAEMHRMASQIANESVMDIWFYVSIGVDVKRAIADFAAQRRFGTAAKGVDHAKLAADIETYGKALEEVGLDLKTSVDQFKKLYEAKDKATAAKRETDEAVKTEWNRWVAAKAAVDAFNAKYGEILAAMIPKPVN